MKLRKSIAFLLSMILILVSAMPVLALDAPVLIPTDERSKTLKKIEITGVDAPKAGKYLDTTAVVKADENISWEIPVFWLGTHDAVSDDSRGDYTVSVSEADGKTRKIRVSYIETQGADAVKAEKDGYYIPVLSFFLPLVYSCGGRVELDKYLSGHKGKYAEANAGRSPWVHMLDLRLSEDFTFMIGKTKHTFELSCSFQNVLNMLNSKWGVEKFSCYQTSYGTNVVSPLKYAGKNDAGQPTFSFNKVNDAYPTETYNKYYTNTNQTWHVLIGLKYRFN